MCIWDPSLHYVGGLVSVCETVVSAVPTITSSTVKDDVDVVYVEYETALDFSIAKFAKSMHLFLLSKCK